MIDLYKILDLEYNATEDDIRKKYLKLAKIYHPDKCKDKDIATKKFQEINYAYNILINNTSRIQYNNINNKDDFHSLLEKIYNGGNIDWESELKKYNINIKKILNINTILNDLNLFEFIKMFMNKKVPKKKKEHNNYSESDHCDETMCEYYNDLPIIYQKYNKNNIIFNFTIDLDDLEEIKKIKVSRYDNYKKNYIYNTYKFEMKSQYIVFNECGDIDIDNGNLIIKLILPDNYTWGGNKIIFNKNISLYEYIYGITFNINEIKINNYIPHRDGNIYNTNYILGNINIFIKFNIIYNYNENNKEKLLDIN
jgi:DnaJ-class molecular chaperone